MNNKIKEILEDWKIGIETGKDKYEIKVDGIGYTWKELNLLLDYITNLQHTEDLYNQLLKDYDELQKENNNLKTSLDESQEVVIDLQQKNEELKSQIEYANKINNEAINRKNKYKSRIEKATEYIEKEIKDTKDNHTYFLIEPPSYIAIMEELLNILNGKE